MLLENVSFKGKTGIITGGAQGIGKAIASQLVAMGGRAVIVDINPVTGEETCRELGNAAFYAVDLADAGQVVRVFEQIIADEKHVDVLINNAGIADVGLLTEVTDERWDRLWRVNVGGVFYTCRAVLPGMIREKRGKIINLSSIWGIAGASCEAAYSATKAAVIGLTKALAKEVGPSGIQVNCIAPGAVETDMNAALDEAALRSLREETPLGRLGTPREIAAAIAFLASEESDFITGQVLSPNGGLVI